MPRALLLSVILMLLGVLSAEAQTALPVVQEVEWIPFRDHCRQLLQTLDKAGSPLPAAALRELKTLLERQPKDPDGATAAVQKVLDAHCLIGVSINPESRVKAARGSAVVQLRQNRPTVVLLKIQNDGGVTHELRVYGAELLGADGRGGGRWLAAEVLSNAPFAPALTGRRLEYRLLRLTPRESGKREATFQFDVGQGTQDLGFRAEVPILFSIRKE